MPLKALLNGEPIYAFHYDSETWKTLKSAQIEMACCQQKAVLKKSKLGTLFFAHHRRGGCNSAPESPQHLFLKSMIAKIAESHDWRAETEKRGETPSGEVWTADVLCTKRTAKIAFEVQWSPQPTDELTRRQAKYHSSSIRALWLCRSTSNQNHLISSLKNNYLIPVFGFTPTQNLSESNIQQFNVSIETFINGIFEGKLQHLPSPRSSVSVNFHSLQKECPSCKQKNRVLAAISIVSTSDNNLIHLLRLNSDECIKLLAKYCPEKSLNRHGLKRPITFVDKYFGGTVTTVNVCYYCNSNIPNVYLSVADNTSHSQGLPTPFYSHNCKYEELELDIKSQWFFKT